MRAPVQEIVCETLVALKKHFQLQVDHLGLLPDHKYKDLQPVSVEDIDTLLPGKSNVNSWQISVAAWNSPVRVDDPPASWTILLILPVRENTLLGQFSDRCCIIRGKIMVTLKVRKTIAHKPWKSCSQSLGVGCWQDWHGCTSSKNLPPAQSFDTCSFAHLKFTLSLL